MDEERRRELAHYFNSTLSLLTTHQLYHYDVLINEHMAECIEIRDYIHTEQALRKDNGAHGALG